MITHITYIYFFYNPGCPGQLARTTTIPRVYWTSCKPSRQVRHREGDRVHMKGRTRDGGQGKPHLLTTELDPQVPHITYLFLFIYLRGCPGQLARTTTNPTAHWIPCKPSGHVRHRGGDRRAHEGSNPGGAEGDKPLPPPGQDPQCRI